jgi:hypothetical protein
MKASPIKEICNYIKQENKSLIPKVEVEVENRVPENVKFVRSLKIGDKITLRDEVCEVVREAIPPLKNGDERKIVAAKVKRPHLKMPFNLKASNDFEDSVEFMFSFHQKYTFLKWKELVVEKAT